MYPHVTQFETLDIRRLEALALASARADLRPPRPGRWTRLLARTPGSRGCAPAAC
jgi:hypothetical protein